MLMHYIRHRDIVPSLEPQIFHLIRQTVPFEEPVSKQWALPISTLYTPGLPLSVAFVSGVMRPITKGYADALVAGGSFLQGDADAFKDELGRGFCIYIMYQIGFARKKDEWLSRPCRASGRVLRPAGIANILSRISTKGQNEMNELVFVGIER